MINRLIDHLFPKKCIGCKKFGNFLCTDCFSKISYNQVFQCPICIRPSVNGLTHPNCCGSYLIDGAIPVVVYKGVVRRIIYQLKYAPYLKALSETIGEIMNEGLIQNESFYQFVKQFKPAVMPIPLYRARQRRRGYNHAEIIANYVVQYFGLVMEDKVLVRIKDTKPQYKLDKQQRIKNIRDAFGIRENQKVPESVIIIDDVATTFATLKEAAKVLKRNGAKQVLGVTFAKEL